MTDVLVYADCFEGDLAPIYKTENDLRISFDILEQPLEAKKRIGFLPEQPPLYLDMTVEEAIRRLDGIQCGKRGTSCPDQLAKILKAMK